MNAQKLFVRGIFAASLIFTPTSAFAQRGNDEGGGRGGFRGGPPGGGFPGGGFPSGGPSGGGFRGGPPGGGFPGGPPGGGGDRGGDRGGRGGSRGGFDPSSFLTRLDRNGNGTIDPDEQQGPAQFLIQRLQSTDSSIKPGQPISIKRVTEAFQKMREGGGDDSSRGGSRSNGDEGLTPELLVPGFGMEEDEEAAPTLLGFGAAAEMMSVAVTEKDREDARNTIRRYDRNRNGVLDKNEISSRMSGNPLDFDRNKDGRLTEGELAVRYARRRETAEDSGRDNRNRDRGRDRGGEAEIVDVYGGRKSYRVLTEADLPKDLPGYFADKDENRDGQIEMAEFAEKWDDQTVEEFFRSDLNRDGFITISEAYQAVEENASSASSGSMASSRGDTDSSPRAAAASSGPVGEVDEKMMAYAERIIGRYDKNNDKQLVKSEYEKMLMSPIEADANKDAIVTVKEYAYWMQSRRSR
ncbi:EF-hand domain-containing protein [Stieleria sp. JC731]|uniref:EF-hand domain-containing protein n=1 Tax=Pirellulaceae TaxID=2691357 RepID=UPI001E4BFE45|nr:EF-hand domain-containing protein [Stieleria sp. JC731]MCC9603474.1 EF-hand domain-containing protein [Stieleria sp. JC731]